MGADAAACRKCLPAYSYLILLFVVVAATTGTDGEHAAVDAADFGAAGRTGKAAWFEARPLDPLEEEKWEESNDPAAERDDSWSGMWDDKSTFGSHILTPDFKPPSGYIFRVAEEDELDSEQGIAKAYIPFESLIYSNPSFTLERSTDSKRASRRTYAPKQVWVTPPGSDPQMYRLSASNDFLIWADKEGRVTEFYHQNDALSLRPHYNASSATEDEVSILSIVVTSSSRYRVVGIDSRGRFVARCLRTKASIDCTALGSKGSKAGSYFWLDLGSALPSYSFKGVAVVSLDANRFFLLTQGGHLMCMETDNRMATWRTWSPPSDVSLEIIADAQVASPRGVFVISRDGNLWQLDVQKEKANKLPKWTCHRFPKKDGPLALMEAIAIEGKGAGSLFLVTLSGALVEWRLGSNKSGQWISHGMPISSKIKSAPIAYADHGVFHLLMVGEHGHLHEYKVSFYRKKDSAAGWTTHKAEVLLAQKRGAVFRKSFWFFRVDGMLIESKISPKRFKKKKSGKNVKSGGSSKGSSSRRKTKRGTSQQTKQRWDRIVRDTEGNLLKVNATQLHEER